MNEQGASYIIDPGADFLGDGGPDNIVNAGLLVTEGSIGTSTIYITGSITNTGTIAADSGTLVLDPASITQLSGGDLSGGTWAASNGATLDLPSGTAITRSQATLALDGSGSSISGIEGLSSNAGSLSRHEGASFTTTGDFSNTGSLTVGVGSTLTVDGNYTQASRPHSRSASAARRRETNTASSRSPDRHLAGSVDASITAGFTPDGRRQLPDRDLCQRNRRQQRQLHWLE